MYRVFSPSLSPFFVCFMIVFFLYVCFFLSVLSVRKVGKYVGIGVLLLSLLLMSFYVRCYYYYSFRCFIVAVGLLLSPFIYCYCYYYRFSNVISVAAYYYH